MAKKNNIKKTGFDALSLEQKKRLFFKKCTSKEELSKFIQVFFGLHLPDQTVSRFADTNPLQIIWEVYDICVNKNNPDEIEDLLYVAGRGSGKCTVKGTHILTNEGIKNIENVNVDDYVYTGWDWNPVKQTYDEGEKPGVKITCKNGKYTTPYALTGSLKHRVQALNSYGKLDWVYMQDLKPGQHIYKSSHSIDNRVDINRDGYKDGWLIGALVGDGAINRHQSNNIRFCSSDFECLRFYSDIVYNKFGVKQQVKRNSKKSVNLSATDKNFKEWYQEYVSGDLCYDKLLKTMEHHYDFLAGFIAGLMDTDGSHDSITLANGPLIEQIGKILNTFGVSCTINNNRRKPRYSEFTKDYVAYHSLNFKTKLPDSLLPLFSKRDIFIEHRSKMNEQFRYPNSVLKPFVDFIKTELNAKNGWITIGNKRVRKTIPYAKELFGSLNKSNNFIYGHKIAALRDFFDHLGIKQKVGELNFILNGYFETVNSITFDNYYFYDLEIHKIHSYWSNGFISHNTLGMAIAELLVMLHDGRDTCHVGAVLAQAKRCYEYQTKFMLSRRIRPIIEDKSVPQEDRVLQKLNMEKSTFNIDDETVTLEVLPCTLKACPTSDNIVKTQHGYKRVDELTLDDKLESVNFQDMSPKLTDILEIKPKYADCVSVELEDGRVISGDEQHKLLTFNGWLKLRDIKPGTKVYSINSLSSKDAPVYRQPNISYNNWENIIVGMMLGDAHLSIPKAGNPRLYKAHSEKQWDYLYSCSDVISKFVDVKRIRDKQSGFGSNMKELITESTKKLLFLKDAFYFDSKKEVKNISKYMSPELLAYWFMDDGIKGDQAGFAVCNFNSDSVDILISELANYGFKSAKLRKSKYPIIVLGSNDTRKLYQLIGKHVHPSMQYKLTDVQAGVAYGLLSGEERKFSKNGVPSEPDTREWRSWRKKYRDSNFIKVINKSFIGKHKVFQIEVDGSNFTEHSYFTNGILSANCNGPHVPLVVTDEIDTVSGEGLKAFKEIAGMLDSKGNKKALRVGISTRKSRYGLMNKMMEEAEQAGRHVRRWTAFEFSQACPDSRSGTTPTKSYHILDEMDVIDEETYKLKDEKKKKEYTEHTMPGEKCLKCPAAAICLGDAKKQKSKSWMLKPISELIQKVRAEGADWALAQLMNLKPSVEGIIYKEFEEKIHVNDWNQMWVKLTGTEYPGECTHDIFVKKCHAMNLSCYAGVDWGWSNPNTVVYFFLDKKDNVFIVRADGMTFVSQPEWVHYIKGRYHHQYRCQLYFPDVADQGAVTEMRKAGLPVAAENDKAINTGIQVIKKLLKVPGSTDTKMHLAKETCGPLITEFLTYHFKTAADGTITEIPESEYDHWLDALRYPLTMLLGKGTLVVGNGMDVDEKEIQHSNGQYFRTPTPEEFATINNIPLNDEMDDKSKLGKIGKLSDLDDEDEDDWNGGGGFLWSL